MSEHSRNQAWDSICLDESNSPIDFHWYSGADSRTWEDALQQVFERHNLTAVDFVEFWAFYERRILDIQRGRILPKFLQYVRKSPVEAMYEISTDFEYGPKNSRIFTRMYHVEPLRLGYVVVGLHLHEKKIFPSLRKLTHDQQEREIDRALQAYKRGGPSDWGYEKRAPGTLEIL